MGVISSERALRISIEGSPTFIYSNASQISASGEWLLDLERDTDDKGNLPAKYLPLDSISISNSSASKIRVEVGVHNIIVSANQTVIKTNIAFQNIKTVNLDSANAISALNIYFNAWKEALTNDELIRRKAYLSPKILGIPLPFKTIIG